METCSIRSSFPGSGLWVTNSGTRDVLKKGSQGTPTSRRTEKGRESAEWAILRSPSLSLIQRGVLEHKLCLRACFSLRQGSWAFDTQTHHPGVIPLVCSKQAHFICLLQGFLTLYRMSSGQGEWWIGWEGAWPGGYSFRTLMALYMGRTCSSTWSQYLAFDCRALSWGLGTQNWQERHKGAPTVTPTALPSIQPAFTTKHLSWCSAARGNE